MSHRQQAMLIALLLISCTAVQARPGHKTNGLSAAFDTPLSFGCNPLTVSFEDISDADAADPITSWKWYFGDGDSSTQQNPIHLYNGVGEYSVTLIVKTASGLQSSITQDDYIIVNATLVPAMDWFIFSSCLPYTVQFLDYTSVCGITIQGWSWDFGDGSTSTQQEPIHDYTSNGSYTVKLTVTSSNGDSVTISKTLVVATFTPAVYLPADTTICVGSVLTLDAGAHTGCSYFWNTGEMTQSIGITSTGYYSVQVNNGTCVANASVHVTAKPPLVTNFIYNQSGNCLPVTVQFTDQSQACSSTIVSWKWYFDGTDSSSLPNPLHVFTTGGSHIIQLITTDNNGLQVSHSRPITINENQLSVHLGNDTTTCFNDSLLLNAGAPFDSYLWSTGSTGQTIIAAGEGTYWVEVNKNGCHGRDTIVVHSTFPLIPAFAYNIGSQCLPVSVHFTDNSQVACGLPVTYWLWRFGDGDSSLLQNPDHIYRKAGQFTVQLTVRNAKGVAITKDRTINIITIGPVPHPIPDTTICAGGSIQLDAGDNEGSTWQWAPAAALNNATIQNPVAFPGATTLFTVAVSKCGVTFNDSLMVYLDSVSRPVVSLAEGGMLVSSPSHSYQWYKDGSSIDNATMKNYKPSAAGDYQVVGSDRGCSSISAKFFYLPDGGHVLPGSKIKVKVSPNPAHETINILLSKTPVKPVTVSVYDVFGRKVYTGVVSNNVNSIDAGGLLKGLYFVELFMNDQRVLLPVQVL